MDGAFTKEIFQALELLTMESRTEELRTNLEELETRKNQPGPLELYEEYSQRSIAETIRTCRERYDRAEAETRGKLKTEVEEEVEDFRIWLEEKRNFDAVSAHYYSISIKSLLFGIKTGLQVALLFDRIIDRSSATTSGQHYR